MNSRVVLADDHKPFRDALRNMLERNRDIEIVGVAGVSADAVELARSLRPDVIVMDVSMSRVAGVATLRQTLVAHPPVKVIVLSVTTDSVFAADMLAAGASACVTKADAEELPHVIRAVLNGISYPAPR